MKRIARQEARKLSLRITARGTRALIPARRSIGTKAATSTAAIASSADHPRVAPAPVVDLVERDQQRDEADRERRDPGVVDPAARRRSGSLTLTRK